MVPNLKEAQALGITKDELVKSSKELPIMSIEVKDLKKKFLKKKR